MQLANQLSLQALVRHAVHRVDTEPYSDYSRIEPGFKTARLDPIGRPRVEEGSHEVRPDGRLFEALVIGGGQAGLGVSVHLARYGIDHVVLERGQVAESWRTQRWDSFVLNTPNWMNRLPGEAGAIEPRDAFLSRDAYAARLEAYAADHRVPIHTGMTITAVSGPSRDGRFTVSASGEDGPTDLDTRNVVVASGLLRVPKIPPIARSFPAGITQMHVGGYRRPADLPTGAVLVVGGGQSGVQIAEDLLGAGRTVYLSTSAVSRLRRRYRGRDSLEWLVDGGFFYDVPLAQMPDPQVRFQTLWTTSGIGRFGHTVSLQALEESGVILLGRPSAVEGDRLRLDDTVGANIAFADQKSAEFNATLEAIIDRAALDAPALEADPADVPHPDPVSVRSPSKVDLGAAGVGTIIWATGFVGDLGFLDETMLDEHGAPVHERGVGRVPGIYFLGFPWLWTRKSGIILGVDEDAGFIADHIAQRLAMAGSVPR
jgi:putative flavoprotein involved in K+ transport